MHWLNFHLQVQDLDICKAEECRNVWKFTQKLSQLLPPHSVLLRDIKTVYEPDKCYGRENCPSVMPLLEFIYHRFCMTFTCQKKILLYLQHRYCHFQHTTHYARSVSMFATFPWHPMWVNTTILTWLVKVSREFTKVSEFRAVPGNGQPRVLVNSFNNTKWKWYSLFFAKSGAIKWSIILGHK